MRNPESILRDLRRISTDNHRCFGCGQEHNCSIHGCAIIREAAALIEGLQGALANSEEARSELGKRLAAAQQELAGNKLERDALVADLKACSDCCTACAHVDAVTFGEDCDGECEGCQTPCPCNSCDETASNFVWKGVVKC